MLKKIVISLICVFMCFGTITSVSANSSKFSFSLDKNMIFQGYNDIYHEDPTQEPDKLKPNIPPEQEVKIDIVLDNQSEEDYLIKLIDENNVVCLENSGVISQQKDILLSIPYTLESGIYKISVKVGDEEQVKEIYLLENLALNSTPYTNATANGSEIVENLIDGCYMNWVSNEAPSSEKPQEFIFDYGSSFVKINTLRFFTNFGNNHGIKKAEILYYNEQLKKWDNIKSDTDSDIFEFYWEKNDSTREPLEIKFDKFYEMNKIMIRVVESNQMWGNNTVISEIQTWGYISKEKYNLSQSSSQGIEGIENVTNIEIDYKDYTGLVTFELVNANDLSSLDNPIQYTKEMVNGKLNYSFIIPKGTPIGKYKIKTVIDDIEDYSLFYEISVDKSLLYNNIDEYIDLSTEYKTINGKIENILDDDITTGWEFETTNNQSINLISKGRYGKTNYILSKIKVYCENSDITKVKLETRTNRTDEKKATVYNDKIILKSDEKGNYFEIDNFVAGLSFEYQLSFVAKGNVTINEIELYGLYLSSHLTDTVKVLNNEKEISSTELNDNDISTVFRYTDNVPAEFIFDYAPYQITSDAMILAANFPKQQGIKQFDLEVFIDNEWKKINSYELSYQTSNEYREISLIKFEKQSFSKMKIKVNDANREWGHFIIAELYLIGNKTTTAQTVANSITDIKQPKLGQMYLEMPELLDDLKDKYLVEIKSSSNEEVISLDGKINPSTDSENVNIVLQVKDKDDLNEIGITKTFTIVVPKALSTTHKYIAPKTDLTSIIKNPGMGWVQYIEGFECRLHDRNEEKLHSELCTIDSSNIDDYWQQMDNLYEKGLPTNILYIRMPWSWFEPEEGKYAWKDKNSELSKLIKGAKERDLELAFRVVLDSSSMKEQAIPEWLFKNYNVDSWDNYNYLVDNPKKEVYLDDEVFLDKLSNFINAFGKEFNQEESNVAFIDGMGYGAWGETSASMRVKSSNEGAMVNTLKRIIDMYAKSFPDVLLGAQTGNSFGDYKYAIEEKGYVMRRDNFGSPDYMSDAARKEILYYISKGVPVYAENCYHHFESMKNNWGNYTIAKNRNETLNRVVNDAIMLHANTLDARVLEDCKLWIENDEKYGDHLIEKFALNGGYRLSLTAIQLPKQLQVNSNITIDHSWINTGVGFLPNKNSHWNNKYKVAFALLDSKTNEVVYQFNESSDNVNPGDWIKENGEYNYTSEFKLPENVKLGDYKFAVAIVNEKLNYQPDINLAIVDEGNFVDKWYVVDTISVVKNEKDELNKAIENAMKIDLSKYTTSSSESFIKVLEAAQLVANKEDATTEEMTTALINLNNAQNSLKYLGDKTELNKLISEIDLLDSTQYTKSSWDELMKVLSKAIEVSKDLDVEQEDVDMVLEELIKIKNKLELRKDDEKDNIIIDKPSTEIKDNQVKTGDTSFIMLNIFFMIISVMSFSFMKRKKYSK